MPWWYLLSSVSIIMFSHQFLFLRINLRKVIQNSITYLVVLTMAILRVSHIQTFNDLVCTALPIRWSWHWRETTTRFQPFRYFNIPSVPIHTLTAISSEPGISIRNYQRVQFWTKRCACPVLGSSYSICRRVELRVRFWATNAKYSVLEWNHRNR